MSPEPAASSLSLSLHLGADPVAVLEAAVWAMAAFVSSQREALVEPLTDVLAGDPARTAVLEGVGLVRRGPEGFVLHPSFAQTDLATARSAVEVKLSSLRQAVSAAADGACTPDGGWGAQPDEVLLHQGRASAATGRALASRIVPQLADCAVRLAAEGSRILDVGTGVGALALATC